MDRDGWLKSMTQFSNICGASPVNNQILFFDGHDINFGDHSLTKIQSKNFQPFILKAGDSINDQPNDNGPNSTLKALYNITKAKWMLKYGITRFQPHRMSYVLVEAWDAFKVSYGNIIVDSFAKTCLFCMSLPIFVRFHEHFPSAWVNKSKVHQNGARSCHWAGH